MSRRSAPPHLPLFPTPPRLTSTAMSTQLLVGQLWLIKSAASLVFSPHIKYSSPLYSPAQVHLGLPNQTTAVNQHLIQASTCQNVTPNALHASTQGCTGCHVLVTAGNISPAYHTRNVPVHNTTDNKNKNKEAIGGSIPVFSSVAPGPLQ
jgi:hypothetical protein